LFNAAVRLNLLRSCHRPHEPRWRVDQTGWSGTCGSDGLAASEEAVKKEALLDAAWPGVTVEEGNLTVQVAALRRLLGDDAIITVPRVGYRLRRDVLLPATAELPRVALLPFATLDGGDGYFADGVAEDIITALGRFREFVTLSRQAALAVRHDPAGNGVRYLVEGSLRRAGERLRVSARLNQTASGTLIWAETYEGVPDDLFEMQDRITEAVVGSVAPQIEAAEFQSARRRPASALAHDLYLRAQAEHLTSSEAGSRAAYELIARALAAEPQNPQYLAAQAWVLLYRPMSGWPDLTGDDRAASRDLALRALEIGTTDPKALSFCANALLHCSEDYELTLATGRRSLVANPNMMLVVFHAAINEMHLGDLGTADALLQRALSLGPADPMYGPALAARAYIAILRGQPEAALAFAAEAMPRNLAYPPIWWMLAAGNALAGRIDEARRASAQLLRLVPGISVARIRAGQPRRFPERIEPVLAGLALAGLPEA
jgi:TolB-like protein